ncbi:MAG: M1 family metallopeptidase, partial [Flavitalea sp.]
IWFHLWPNAYKNDRTAFSEQRLRTAKTDFYFSSSKQRGYINQLNFTQNNEMVKTEDHPVHQDIIKVILNKPLFPGKSTQLSTPFHVKLPARYSRSGYTSKDIAVTQWYPKPAVYDKLGWHPMPYLDMGEFYAEFGDFKVKITAPEKQVIAAGGKLLKVQKEGDFKIYSYTLEDVTDFAWFTSPHYIIEKDTVQLFSGKVIDVAAYYFDKDTSQWKSVIEYTKDALRTRSHAIADYPYQSMTVVRGADQFSGGMEYPSITMISGDLSGPMLDFIIEHEIGHNWFQSALGSNEREFPWMDEGLNTFYDYKYFISKYGSLNKLFGLESSHLANKKFPSDFNGLVLSGLEAMGVGQAISTPSEKFSAINYALIPYHKTSQWLSIIENQIGKENLSNAIKQYYIEWKNRHPYPEDLRAILKQYYTVSLDNSFNLIYRDGPLFTSDKKRRLKPVIGINFRNSETYHYIGIMPAVGFNRYDKIMPGLIIHNYNLPANRINFLAVPLFSTGAKTLNGLARINYHKPGGFIAVGADFMRFSKRAAFDTSGNKQFERFSRISPYFRYYLPQAITSSLRRFIEFRSFIISETDFQTFTPKLSDTTNFTIYVDKTGTSRRYINQLSFIIQENRILYPYDYNFQLQQGKGFYRVNLTGNHYFNYRKYGGLNVRLFASKFGYVGNGLKNSPDAYRYMPKLLGNTGEEDFTYSNYFGGRTATYAGSDESIPNAGFAAQQIMIRDGGMKMRLDYFDFLQGRSDDWIAAINLNSSLPSNLFPIKLPLKLFFDAGTSSEYWKDSYEGSRFLYVSGVQLSLLQGTINVYAPLVYSKDIKDNLRSVPELNKFTKRLTFSIDIQRINLRRLSGNQIPL